MRLGLFGIATRSRETVELISPSFDWLDEFTLSQILQSLHRRRSHLRSRCLKESGVFHNHLADYENALAIQGQVFYQ